VSAARSGSKYKKMAFKYKHILIFLLLVTLSWSVSCLKKAKFKKKPRVEPPEDDIGEILKNHEKIGNDASIRKFQGDSLAFVTPWNAKGYDFTRVFRKKFTHISPCWYQIRSPSWAKEKHGREDLFDISGRETVDTKWVENLRSGNDGGEGDTEYHNQQVSPKIVPRFLVDGWHNVELAKLLSSEELQDRFAALIKDEVVSQGFDGAVLDGLPPPIDVMERFIVALLQRVVRVLHEVGKELIFVMPTLPNKEPYQVVLPVVDKVSINMYDYNQQRAGPVEPLHFMTSVVLSALPPASRGSSLHSKIMIGLNFYGKEWLVDGSSPHPNEHLTADMYLDLLRRHNPVLQWDTTGREHFFTFSAEDGARIAWYPSLKSIRERLDLAQEMGVGVSVWEAGQGLTYFGNLF